MKFSDAAALGEEEEKVEGFSRGETLPPTSSCGGPDEEEEEETGGVIPSRGRV